MCDLHTHTPTPTHIYIIYKTSFEKFQCNQRGSFVFSYIFSDCDLMVSIRVSLGTTLATSHITIGPAYS